MAKPKQRSNPSFENNYNTASDNNIYRRCKHFYSILSSDFREDEFLSGEYFCFAIETIRTRPPNSRGFYVSARGRKLASLCILNIFFFVAMTKTFQHLKQWQPNSIVSALYLESVRRVNCYEVHKRPKTTVVSETSFLLAKPNGYPTFHGRRFSMGAFL